MKRPAALLGALALAGLACSIFGALPGPTEKTVTPADVAGGYIYQTDTEVVGVTLNADGTFGIADTSGMAGLGAWHLDGAEIVLDFTALSPATRERPGGWYVYDDENGGFAIMGGEGDPDAWPGLSKAP